MPPAPRFRPFPGITTPAAGRLGHSPTVPLTAPTGAGPVVTEERAVGAILPRVDVLSRVPEAAGIFVLFFAWRFTLAVVVCRAAARRLLAAKGVWRRRRRRFIFLCWSTGWVGVVLGLLSYLVVGDDLAFSHAVFQIGPALAVTCGLLSMLCGLCMALIVMARPSFDGERGDAWLCATVGLLLGTPYVPVVVI